MAQQSNLLGCLWMLAGGLLFVAVTVLVRHLGSDLPAIEAAFIRYLIGVVLVLPMIWRMRWRGIRAGSFRLYFYRGLVHGVAVMLWFFAMARIPLAEVTAIGFSTPVFTAIGAILIFGEQVRARRMLAIAAGFIGTLVILRPGFQTIESGSLAQLVAAFFFAGSFLLAKKMTERENGVTSGGDLLLAPADAGRNRLAGAGRGVRHNWPLRDYARHFACAADGDAAAVLPAAGVGDFIRLLVVRRSAGQLGCYRSLDDRWRGQLSRSPRSVGGTAQQGSGGRFIAGVADPGRIYLAPAACRISIISSKP
jgi:uncharacterized membrane protein